ncbi:MAG: DUF1127 domain-containing protein [Hyphomicrobiales bacterium]|nr:DUF1127 domain-containing protein [Hyphomicrobiales bacterium]
MAILPGTLTALMIALAKTANRVRTAMENRRAAKELLAWDNRALKDIGLTRSDVRGALQLPFNQDPTLVLSLIAAGGETRHRRESPAGRAVPPARPNAAHAPGILPSAAPALCN